MIIKKIEETSNPGMIKVIADEGAAFFLRKEYLINVDFDSIDVGKEYSDEEQVNEILDGGLASAVEIKAISYLARCEQSHFGLSRKLLEKGYEKKYIEMAFAFLEKKNLLSDLRFSSAWLNSRRIGHYEGRPKLMAELQSRGISREVANKALDEFFEENDEQIICRKAYEKLLRKGKTEDKLVAAMIQAGFSYKMIKEAMNSQE